MQGDLRSLDPIWTTANITAYHGAMIYDTLFALDGDQRTQPQMVCKFGVSDDKLTHTFELRDGLKFSDGSAVTADDVVAVDPPMGGARRRRPAHDAAREGYLEEGRQDLRRSR
jgi:ABC-type transport system substrate-binding protein